ncbi:MAG: hypothetical protein L3J75_14700 [Methylococcaceae bacterium]|nr:hypothetical protein [Methylococcaceae bacterium]
MELSDKLQIIALPLEIVGFFLAAVEMFSNSVVEKVEKFLDDFAEFFSRLNFNIDSPNEYDGSFVFAINFIQLKEVGEYEQLELFHNPKSKYHFDPNFLPVGIVAKFLVLIYSISVCLPIISTFNGTLAKILVTIFLFMPATYLLSMLIMFFVSFSICTIRDGLKTITNGNFIGSFGILLALIGIVFESIQIWLIPMKIYVISYWLPLLVAIYFSIKIINRNAN